MKYKNTKLTELFTSVPKAHIPDMGEGHVFANCVSEEESASPVEGYIYQGHWVGVNSWHGEVVSPSGTVVAELASDPLDPHFSLVWRVLSSDVPEWLQELDQYAAREAVAQAEAALESLQEEQARKQWAELNHLKKSYNGTKLGKFVAKKAPHLLHLIAE